jgi:branched-chain amino acid transport system ATP-binding protein
MDRDGRPGMTIETAAATGRETPAGDSGGELVVQGLDAWYGDAQALFGVDFRLTGGRATGVVGLNGAGKSTLLRTIARVHRKMRGRVLFDGQDLSGLSPEQCALAGVSLVREGGRLFANLTIAENLSLGRRLGRARRGAASDPEALNRIWTLFPMLEARQSLKAAYLSGGQRQALALSVALASEPALLLLDEPSAGLAPSTARSFFASLAAVARGDITLLVVEQNRRWIDGLVDEILVLENGRVRS